MVQDNQGQYSTIQFKGSTARYITKEYVKVARATFWALASSPGLGLQLSQVCLAGISGGHSTSRLLIFRGGSKGASHLALGPYSVAQYITSPYTGAQQNDCDSKAAGDGAGKLSELMV
jgi:hypothetical protein